jgi:pyridoxal 5'-phosphate synthase pdxS subunit
MIQDRKMNWKRYELNVQLAQMLKGGVIMDVTNVEQAKIAEEAGAVSVMALERVPESTCSRLVISE